VLVPPPPSARSLLLEEKDDFLELTRTYWERFEMDSAELPSWETTLFCRLGDPLTHEAVHDAGRAPIIVRSRLPKIAA
jgi:hypothetical protein